jgi:hypothetical protein
MGNMTESLGGQKALLSWLLPNSSYLDPQSMTTLRKMIDTFRVLRSIISRYSHGEHDDGIDTREKEAGSAEGLPPRLSRTS